MRVLKRTYALPADVLAPFEAAVAPGPRSAVVAQLLRSWAEEQKREQLRREVVEGGLEMADVYCKVESAYHPLEEEAARALDV